MDHPWGIFLGLMVGETPCNMVSHCKFSFSLVELFGSLSNGAELSDLSGILWSAPGIWSVFKLAEVCRSSSLLWTVLLYDYLLSWVDWQYQSAGLDRL